MQSKAKIDRIINNSLDAHNKYKLFSSYKRNKLLRKLSKKLILNKSIIINTISKEISKTINDAEIEFNRALRTIDFGAEETLRIYGKVYPCDIFADEIQKKAYVGKVPLGIILAVTPYNFPLNIPLHKIIPALSTGNAIIFKPSPLGKKTANLIQKLVIECGFPKNILQTIHCSESFLQKLLLEEKINMVSYTGSSLFGKKIRSISNISKINLEMGGNNPLIIMKDANLDNALNYTIKDAFGNAGQRCTAAKLIFLEKDIANKFKDELIIRIRKLKFGNHLKKTTDMGPLVNKSVKENLLNKIKKINKTKYNINFFGKISKNFVPPIIITHKKNLLEFIDDEFFGPIVQLITFEKLSECVKAINKSNYALQAGIFTNSNQYINYAYENLSFGALIVNAGPGLRIESIPFGGLKDSGSGREGIVMAMNEMMEEKVLIN